MTTKKSFAFRTSAAMALAGVATHFLLLHSLTAVVWVNNLLSMMQTRSHEISNYLQGNFGPISEEHCGIALSVIEGELPPDLDGLFVRNGPNPLSANQPDYHWFDGHGMMHNVRIQDGHALYCNTYIQTPRFKVEHKLGGQRFFLSVGEMKGIGGLFKMLFLEKYKHKVTHMASSLTVGQANTHSVMYQNKFYALHEASLPLELVLSQNGGVADVVGHETLGGVLNYPVSAHPKVDFQTGHLVFHGYSSHPKYIFQDGPLKVGEYNAETATMDSYFGVHPPDNGMSFVHDMAFTKNWIILYDTSAELTLPLFSETGSFIKWNQDKNLKIGLVPRKTHPSQNVTSTDVIWFDAGSPHVIIHPLNAWEEEDGTVVMWTPLADDFTLDLGAGVNSFAMTELRMDPKTGSVNKTRIDQEYNVEFSRVRDDFVGRFARFGYTGFVDPAKPVEGTFNGFNVWDMERKMLHKTVWYPDGQRDGEPVIIPKPNSTNSNEVYIGSFMYNEADETSSFVLYDGEAASEKPVVRLSIPYRVPYGFHGRWVEGAELEDHFKYHEKNKKRQNIA